MFNWHILEHISLRMPQFDVVQWLRYKRDKCQPVGKPLRLQSIQIVLVQVYHEPMQILGFCTREILHLSSCTVPWKFVSSWKDHQCVACKSPQGRLTWVIEMHELYNSADILKVWMVRLNPVSCQLLEHAPAIPHSKELHFRWGRHLSLMLDYAPESGCFKGLQSKRISW